MASDADAGGTDSWEKVLFLLLGWLLATLSPIIADAIRRRRESKAIKAGLLTELQELKFRMAIVNYHIEMKYGKVDRSYLEWLRPIVAAYTGPNRTDRILKSIDMQLAAPDQLIAALSEMD